MPKEFNIALSSKQFECKSIVITVICARIVIDRNGLWQ